jgi:hypothetical protein
LRRHAANSLERDDEQLDLDLVLQADLGCDAVGADAELVAIDREFPL